MSGVPDGPMLVLRGGKDVTRELAPVPTDNPLRDALCSIERTLAFSAADHGRYHREAWVYGIALGWCDHHTGPACTGDPDDPLGGCALLELARDHGWDDETVERLLLLRAAWKAAAS